MGEGPPAIIAGALLMETAAPLEPAMVTCCAVTTEPSAGSSSEIVQPAAAACVPMLKLRRRRVWLPTASVAVATTEWKPLSLMLIDSAAVPSMSAETAGAGLPAGRLRWRPISANPQFA